MEPHRRSRRQTRSPRVAFAASTASPTIHHHRVPPIATTAPPMPPPHAAHGRGVVRPRIGERTRRSASHEEDLARRPHTERGAHRPTVHRRRSLTGNRAWGRSSPGSYARGRINWRTTRGERSLSAHLFAPQPQRLRAWTAPQEPPIPQRPHATCTSTSQQPLSHAQCSPQSLLPRCHRRHLRNLLSFPPSSSPPPSHTTAALTASVFVGMCV